MIHLAAQLGKEGRAHVRVVIQEFLGDPRDGVGGSVHKLGDIGRAVGSSEIGQHHRRAALAPLVNVCEEELRIRRVDFGGEHQPAAVGRPTVPGIHARGVAPQPPRLPALGGNDVQLAVRLEQHVIPGLAEDDPLAVRRVLREIVAPAISRGPGQRLRFPSLAVVVGNPVEIIGERLAVPKEFGAIFLASSAAPPGHSRA